MAESATQTTCEISHKFVLDGLLVLNLHVQYMCTQITQPGLLKMSEIIVKDSKGVKMNSFTKRSHFKDF